MPRCALTLQHLDELRFLGTYHTAGFLAGASTQYALNSSTCDALGLAFSQACAAGLSKGLLVASR